MKDLLLTSDGDLCIDDNANVEITDSVIQEIQIRLRWFLGEWKINPEWGLPYYEQVFVKNPNLAIIEDLLRTELLTIERVQSVESIKIKVDNRTRTAAIVCAVTVDNEKREGEVPVDV